MQVKNRIQLSGIKLQQDIGTKTLRKKYCV